MGRKKLPIGGFWPKINAVKFCKVRELAFWSKDILPKNYSRLKFLFHKSTMTNKVFFIGEIARRTIRLLLVFCQNR